jgi:hypothetical protein
MALKIQGFFTDYQLAKWQDYLFIGTAYTRPTNIYVGLSITQSLRSGTKTEVSGASYARVSTSTASWAQTFNGTTSNILAITFPAPLENWGTVVAMFLADAVTGGNVIAMADLAIPRTIKSGDPAKSFAVGSISISRS